MLLDRRTTRGKAVRANNVTERGLPSVVVLGSSGGAVKLGLAWLSVLVEA